MTLIAQRESLPTRGAWIEIVPFLRHLPTRIWSLPTRGAWIEIQWPPTIACEIASRSPHGERGLKSLVLDHHHVRPRRSPHGERGLKCRCNSEATYPGCRSPHGERGLKFALILNMLKASGRSPHGERGLKYEADYTDEGRESRSPHGERGLKWSKTGKVLSISKSLPTRGAWIEIGKIERRRSRKLVAPHTGSVD